MVRVAAALILSLAAVTFPARADDAKRFSLARQVVAVTHVAEKVRPLLPGLAPMVRQALSNEMVDPATIGLAIERVQHPSSEDIDHLSVEIAALYARELTEQDLSDMLAFYETPSGRDMLAKEAEIGGGIGVLAAHWALSIADTAAAEAKAVPALPDPQRWRQEYISAPAKAAVLQRYIDPMEKPEWTALRNVTLAKTIADRCSGARLDDQVLGSYLAETGLDRASVDDLDTMKAMVAPAFSYFDTDRLKLICVASDDLFGSRGKLVPNLVSSGNGMSIVAPRGYLSVSPFTDFPRKGG